MAGHVSAVAKKGTSVVVRPFSNLASVTPSNHEQRARMGAVIRETRQLPTVTLASNVASLGITAMVSCLRLCREIQLF